MRERAVRSTNGRAVLLDALLALGYAVTTIIGSSAGSLLRGTWPTGPDVITLAGALVGMAALLVRRRSPWLLFAAMWVVALISSFVSGGLDPVGVGIALYTLAVYRSRPAVWRAFALTVVGYVVAAVVSVLQLVPEGAGVRDASPVFLLVVLVCVLLGLAVIGRRQRIAALVERATWIEQERARDAALIAANERARIAREMHDVVAHGVSVMVSLADGADAVAERDPARSRTTIVQVANTGRQTLAEMRRVLAAIGDQDAGTTPSPVLADLPALIASYRDAGLPVALRQTGRPRASLGAQSAVYRIVQEGLTNALRYSDEPTEVTVDVDYGDGVTVTVTDDGREGRRRGSLGSGRGLVGVEERARLWGGSAVSGPIQVQAGSGWRLQATMPDASTDHLMD